jgi:hypothetical protein
MSQTLETANTALSTAVIIAIVVPSVIVGIGLLICFSVLIYCLCCRKTKTYPGMVMQPQAPQQGGYNNQSGGDNNQPGNRV